MSLSYIAAIDASWLVPPLLIAFGIALVVGAYIGRDR